MSPSVTLGAKIIGEEAAKREARNMNNGMGGGSIVLGPAFDLKPAEEPEDPPETFTLLQAEQLLEKDPAAWVRVLKAEGARATVRKSIAKAVLKATEGQVDEDDEALLPVDVYESLKRVVAGTR